MAPPPDDSGSRVNLNPWPQPEMEEALSREYRVATINWTDADVWDTNLAEIRFPEALFGLTILKQRAQYFRYYATDVKVRVEVQGPPTNGGAIAVIPMPFYYVSMVGSARNRTVGQRAQWTGYAEISASQGGAHEFIIPWKANAPFARMAYCGVDPSPGPGERAMTGTLMIYVIAPLEMPGASSAPVTINVFAQLVNLRLAGPSPLPSLPLYLEYGHSKEKTLAHGNPSEKAQSGKNPQKKEGAVRSEKGTLSSIAGAVSAVSGTLASIPGLEPLAAVSAVSSFAGKALESLGLDQPADQQAPQPTRRGHLQTYTHGLAPVEVFTETPGSVCGRLGDLLHIDEENPSFVQLAQKPGIIDRFSIDSTAAIDSQVRGIAVHPMVYPMPTINAVVVADATPMAIASAGFAYWRGSIKYLLRVFCSSMTVARLRICFFPDTAAPPATVESVAGDVLSKIVEIRGDTEVEFSIPFLYHKIYSKTFAFNTDLSSATVMLGNGPTAADIVGYVVIYLLSPVRTYDAAASFMTCYLWAAAGPDWQLHKYMGRMGTTYTSAVPSPEEIKVKKRPPGADSAYVPETAQCSRSIQTKFREDFPTFLPAKLFKDKMVVAIDPPTSPHVLARRPFSVYSSNGTDLATLSALKQTPPWYITGGSVAKPWLHWIMSSFRGIRGGCRLAYDLALRTTSGIGGGSTATGELQSFMIRREFGDRNTSIVLAKEPTIHLEIPWEEVNLYQQPLVQNLVVGSDDQRTMEQLILTILGGVACTNINLNGFMSVADDFQLIDWVPPLLTKAQ